MSVVKCRLCRHPVSMGTAYVEPGHRSVIHKRCNELTALAMDLHCGDVFFLETLQPFRISYQDPTQDPK